MAAHRVGTEVALDFLTTESGQEDQSGSHRKLQTCVTRSPPEPSPSSFRSRAGSAGPNALDCLVCGPCRSAVACLCVQDLVKFVPQPGI